ncbi:Heat shock protein ssb1, partial [Coemansia sp. RSA 485]
AKNNLEALIHQIESTVSDITVSTRLKNKDRETLENALAESMEWLDANGASSDKASINAAHRKLELAFKRAFAAANNQQRGRR